jgi:hypothetical protein
MDTELIHLAFFHTQQYFLLARKVDPSALPLEVFREHATFLHPSNQLEVHLEKEAKDKGICINISLINSNSA